MNVLKSERKAKIVQLISEGMTLRGVSRATGHHLVTVLRVLNEVGETWSYLTCKQIRCQPKHGPDAGDQFLYIGLEQSSKAVISHVLGRRNDVVTDQFIADLASRVVGRFHLASDGWAAYPRAVARHLQGRVDYGQQIKSFGHPNDPDAMRRYAPPKVTAVQWRSVAGYPNRKYITTSHVERFNASLRTACRRFARLSLAVNRKFENLENGIRLAIASYNFVRVHRGVKMTPAMALGVTDRPWTYLELVP